MISYREYIDMTVTYKLLELKVKQLPETAGNWHYFHFQVQQFICYPHYQSITVTVFLYPLLKIYYLKMYVTPSFESYQMATHSALKLGQIRSVKFEGKLIGCNVAVKQYRCWTVRPVNIEISNRLKQHSFDLLLEINMQKYIQKGITNKVVQCRICKYGSKNNITYMKTWPFL